jgi:purine-nucleoside/S-methyl-5'-thioadenosine phosphorylase / adenosine deaminase
VSAVGTTVVELPGARAIFSSRLGGVSEGAYAELNLGILTDDEPERVSENRRRLAEAAGLDQDAVAMGWQVHGAELREWEAGSRAFASPGEELPKVDGHLTDQPGLGLLVLVADCYPVALAGDGRVAMLHCGWRGLAQGIVEAAIDRFRAAPAAAVGPGIGPCCYEVGREVLEALDPPRGAANGRALDLRAVIDHRLRAGGVERVEHVDHCTSCRPALYFSHRRDNGVTGRQAGLVVRDG